MKAGEPITYQGGTKRRVDVGFAELHSALFHGGKNHGLKLDIEFKPDFKMVYDRDEKELEVTWKGRTTHVLSTSVLNYTSIEEMQSRRIAQSGSPQVASISHAQVETPSTRVQNPLPQVETPMSHVHKGKGHGKTGQTK